MAKSNFTPPKRVTAENFGRDDYAALLGYIEDKVKYTLGKTKNLREELLPKWVRIYRGVPAEEHKDWPWPGASNLVIQVAGTHCDELLSRVMAMYVNDPLYNVKILGDFNADTDASGDDQAEALEYFMQDCAYEPTELDLYRVEETGFSSAIRFGTGVFKFPWEYLVEQQAVYVGGASEPGDKFDYQWKDLVKRDGPHPEVVPLADWSLDPKWPNLNLADFKIHTLHMDYYQLQQWKKHPHIYDAACIDEVLLNPDPIPEYRKQLDEQKRIEDNKEGHCGDNYDIEECWFTFNKSDGSVFRLVCYYHVGSETNIGIIYNVYPDNEEPFEDAKLAYDDDTYFGYGFCEMLDSYQREVSTTHNWRVDNRHFATTGVGRVNKNSKLSSILQLYPGVLIPADQDEIEPLAFGGNALQYGTEDESLTLSLATQRTGIDPAVGGSGGGTVNPKKGTFSAQGTAIVNQAANNRNNLRMSDMRSCHVRMGRKILKMYSYYGLGNKIRKYGDNAKLLQQALDNYKSQRLGLVIKPATASENREMEKQNEILLSGTLERLYQADLQAMQILSAPEAQQDVKDLLVKQLRAKNALMKSLLRAFGRQDVNRLLAVPDILKEGRKALTNGSGGGSGAVNPQTIQGQGATQGAVPIGGGQVNGAVPVQ